MKQYMIPIITPELIVVFGDTPCCDIVYQQDGSHMRCRATKTLILLDNADFALVHSRMLIKPDCLFRRPNRGSREILLRIRTHGNPCVPSYLPEQARSSQRLHNVRVDRCRTHWKDSLEVEAPVLGRYDNEEGQYMVVPNPCQFDEDENGNPSLASDDREIFEESEPEQPQVAQSVKIIPSSKPRLINNERWTMIEKEDAEDDDADWDILDGEQIQEDYWEDYFVFNGSIMGARKSATL